MGKIWKKIKIEGYDKIHMVNALFDSGSANNIINPDFAKAIKFYNSSNIWKEKIYFGKRKIFADTTSINIIFKWQRFPTKVSILPIKEKLIIGYEFLQMYNISLDYKEKKLKFKNKIRKIKRY